MWMWFAEYIGSWKPYEISDMFEVEINRLGSFLLTHNYEFVTLIACNLNFVRESLWNKHIAMIKKWVEESVFQYTFKCKDFGINYENEPIELYQKMAYVRWNNEAY